MAYTTKAAEYLGGVGSTNNETDFFFIFVAHLMMVGKKPVMRYSRVLNNRRGWDNRGVGHCNNY